MTDDKEDEFRKIHDEYKGLVDFMLSSFMEDLQVSPEQVEEACRLREAGSGATESHVTKVLCIRSYQRSLNCNTRTKILTFYLCRQL